MSLSSIVSEIHSSIEESNFGKVYNLLSKGSEFDESEIEEDKYPFPDNWKNEKKITIHESVDIDEPDESRNNYTMLHKAIEIGNIDIVRLLLMCGADVNAQTVTLDTSLHVGLGADTEHKIAIFHLLLQNGGNFEIKNNKNLSPMELSVILRCDSCTRLMVEYGADVSCQYDNDLLSQVKQVANIQNQDTNKYDEYNFPLPNQVEAKKLLDKSANFQKKKSKKRNVKWEKMLKTVNEDGMITDKKLKKRIRKGIPNSMRSKVWKYLLPIAKCRRENHGIYNELLKKGSAYTKQIDLDINRTFREHLLFRKRYGAKQLALFNILKAYSIYDPLVGYCQGMSTITALLLMYIEDEEDVFWYLVTLMRDPKYDLKEIFLTGFPRLLESFYLHEEIMKKKLPKLMKHFKRQNLVTSMYATKWYMLLMLDILPFSVAVRIWEIFFSEGQKVIFSFTLSLLKIKRKELLKKKFDQIIPYLQNLSDIDLDTENLVFLSTKRKIKQKVLKKYSELYVAKKTKEDKQNKRKMNKRMKMKRFSYYQ